MMLESWEHGGDFPEMVPSMRPEFQDIPQRLKPLDSAAERHG
jgi:hypothetical protein